MEEYRLELYHHGTKGMKWGRRLYQHKDGSLTALGRLRYGKKGAPDSHEKKQLSDEEVKAAISAKKDKIIASRSSKELYKNADLFTTDELNNAYKRLELEKRIRDLNPNEKSKGEAAVDRIIKAGNKAAEFATMGSKVYNHMARLHNTFASEGDPWPIIGSTTKQGIADDKRKKQQQTQN